MDSIQNCCLKLSTAYEQKIRQQIEHWTPDRVQALDDQFKHLVKLSKDVEQPISIGLLGSAAAGKSTLLNAIAFKGQSILPTGGVGALTAQATRLVYSQTPYFQVHYDVTQVLNQLIFGLKGVLGLLKKGKKSLKYQNENISTQEMDDIPVDSHDDFGGSTEKKRVEKQAALLIKGNQNTPVEPAELLGALEQVLGRKLSVPVPNLSDEDRQRIQRLQIIIKDHSEKNGNGYKRHGAWDDRDFRTDLRDHAAGFLAPIVKDLEVGYPWELCDDRLQLIDLPGVGVSRDSYVSVTESFIRDKAQAIILVVNRSGIEDSGRKLLEQSGFLQRLIHSADHPESDPLLLFVVATKTDESVKSKVREAKQVGETLSPLEVMDEIRDNLESLLRDQLRAELNDIASKKSGLAREAAGNVIRHVLTTAQFHAVSSSQYGLVHDPDDFERPFIKHEDQSGIPDLNLDISIAVEDFQKQRLDALTRSLFQIDQQLSLWINSVNQRYISSKFAEEKIAELQRTLRDDLAPLLKEVQVRLGKFHEFLNEGMDQTLETILAQGSQAASEDIRRYLSGLRGMHWASLRATVRKGGAHFGTNVVELPHIFSDHLEGQLAPLWQSEVLNRLGKRIEELAQDLSAIVKEMASWAVSHDLSEGNSAALSLADQMHGDIDQLTSLIEESSQNLREMVRKHLYQAIRKPIAEHCQKFVNADHDVGAGVKVRILDCFDDMVLPSLRVACCHAKIIFKQSLDTAGQVIRDRLKPYADIQKSIEEQILPAIDIQQQAEFDRLRPLADASTNIVRQALEDCRVKQVGNINTTEAVPPDKVC